MDHLGWFFDDLVLDFLGTVGVVSSAGGHNNLLLVVAMIATSVAANSFKIQTEYLIAGQSNFIFYCRSDPRASICVQTEYSLQLGAASGPMVTGKGVERLIFVLYPADSSCQSCPAREGVSAMRSLKTRAYMGELHESPVESGVSTHLATLLC